MGGHRVKIAVIFGTRPEAIKMAPVIHAARRMAEPLIISSGQHRDMIAPILDWFQIQPDHDLALMQPGQTPQDLLARALLALNGVLEAQRPDAVLVQGDTSTALAGALAAFHLKIPVGHVEAGLRTGDILSPFPEEANRQLISRIAAWHFAPTQRQAEFLKAEKVSGTVSIVGNTVVDALEWTSKRLGAPVRPERPIVVVTAHRRESFGAPIREAFAAIGELAVKFPGFDFVYPVHRNPNVLEPAKEILGAVANVKLIDPLEYPELIDLLRRSHLVISDSGGIQEEAPSFGVPVLILRESTERPEVIDAGIGHLVGTSRERIVEMGSHFLGNPQIRLAASSAANPFGDGRAGEKIIDHLLAAGPAASLHV